MQNSGTEMNASSSTEESGDNQYSTTPRGKTELVRATTYWAGLEYLNLVDAPKADPAKLCWDVAAESDLPWVHSDRKMRLRPPTGKETGIAAHCGLVSKKKLTKHLRDRLGAPAINTAQMRGDGATPLLIIPLDANGFVSGTTFISSTGWGLKKIEGDYTDVLVAFNGFKAHHEYVTLELLKFMRELLLVPDPENEGHDKTRPITVADVERIVERLVTLFEWPIEWYGALSSSLLRVQAKKLRKEDLKNDLVKAMNSFVAEDIVMVGAKIATDDVGRALQDYLRGAPRPDRIDVRDENLEVGLGQLLAVIRPDRASPGGWPDKTLVTAQQFAVNMMTTSIRAGGIYSVNGPPGTGKSTLLREVISCRLIERAELMCEFKSPLDAFNGRFEIEGRAKHLAPWAIDTRLRGHGIVVASSNNGAVENVTVDLPKLSEDVSSLGVDFFSAVSDSVAAARKAVIRSRKTWGLIAAVLGSADRKKQFFQRYWFSDIDEQRPPDGTSDKKPPLKSNRLRSLRGLMTLGDHDAKPWDVARRDFKNAVQASKARAAELTAALDAISRVNELPGKITELSHSLIESTQKLGELNDILSVSKGLAESAARSLQIAKERYRVTQTLVEASRESLESRNVLRGALQKCSSPPVEQCEADLIQAQDEQGAAEKAIERLQLLKPGIFASIFSRGVKQAWLNKVEAAIGSEQEASAQRASCARSLAIARQIDSTIKKLRISADEKAKKLERASVEAKNVGVEEADSAGVTREVQAAEQAHSVRTTALKKASEDCRNQQASIQLIERNHAKAKEELEAQRKVIAEANIDQNFVDASGLHLMEDAKMQLLAPYEHADLTRLRRDVFKAAIELHKAFIAEAWPRLKLTLSTFVDVMSGRIGHHQLEEGSIMSMWDSFFLTVPVVSTTFASFAPLFKGVTREQLGWLLIDEAGQATPQAALGAIWRARSVVVVGDPNQLEPIAGHPTEMSEPWRKACGVSDVWRPGDASVQVLADISNLYGTYLGASDKSQWVGSPLRVHRRCLDPMFRVSNEIAYANLMVHSVQDKTKHNDWLGHSCWIDVSSSRNSGHLVHEQCDLAIHMLKWFVASKNNSLRNMKGDLHVNLISPFTDVSDALRDSIHKAYAGRDEERYWEMSGTVHTFQGKEADVVIFVLGGDPANAGAIREFAGSTAKPNLLNVAITRAKQRLYVIGDHDLWTRNSAIFARLARSMECVDPKNLMDGYRASIVAH